MVFPRFALELAINRYQFSFVYQPYLAGLTAHSGLWIQGSLLPLGTRWDAVEWNPVQPSLLYYRCQSSSISTEQLACLHHLFLGLLQLLLVTSLFVFGHSSPQTDCSSVVSLLFHLTKIPFFALNAPVVSIEIQCKSQGFWNQRGASYFLPLFCCNLFIQSHQILSETLEMLLSAEKSVPTQQYWMLISPSVLAAFIP